MRQQILSWWLPLILLAGLAFFLQAHTYFYKDNAYILHTAILMLQGETYTQHIFEPNPPLIFFIQMPAVLLAQMTSIPVLMCFRFYVILLGLFSISLSYYLLQLIFEKNKKLIYIFSFILIFNLFFLPANQFGQREHFMMMLTLPYIFSSMLALENKKIHYALTLFIALIASIGFVIKPQFLIVPLFIELALMGMRRKLPRIEGWIIAGVVCVYLGSILLFYPEYLHTVLPSWKSHYIVMQQPWSHFLLDPVFLFCLAAVCVYLYYLRDNHYPAVSVILLLAWLGFIINFLLPKVDWYYHLLPALSLSLLLIALMYGQIARLNIGYLFIASAILFTPVSTTIFLFYASMKDLNNKEGMTPLIQFLNHNGSNNSFDTFTMAHNYIDLEYYSTAKYVGSFVYCSWYYNLFDPKERKTFPLWENYSVNIIADDLHRKKPRFILVDTVYAKKYLGIDIPYIQRFSHYANFRNEWKHYSYLTTMSGYQIYKRQGDNL